MKEKDLIQKLYELQGVYSEHTIPSKRKGCYEVKVTVEGHQHLMFLITDLIKVCILALDEGARGGDAKIPNPQINVGEVLRLALDIIPYEHMQFIEEVEELIQEHSSCKEVKEKSGLYFSPKIAIGVC